MQYLKNKLVVFLGVMLFINCNLFKTVQILKGGSISQKEFKVEIPFEYRLGLIIIAVNIEGKKYDFLLDSGAVNLVSKSLASDLKLKPHSQYAVGDSHETESELHFTTLNNITIGGVDFVNTGAAIADLEASNEVACLDIQGVIGANLMRQAIWKIDYDNQKIILTDRLERLTLPATVKNIPFYSDVSGSPLCDVQVNGVLEKEVVIDLGSNGAIELTDKTFEKLKAKNPNLKSIAIQGRQSSGLYGTGEIKTHHHASIDRVTYGNIRLKNQIISFASGSATLGNQFFKNYDLILNFKNKEALLVEKSKFDFSKLEGFGFSSLYDQGKLIIGTLTVKSQAEQKGLKIGDHILSINEKDYSQINAKDWCELLEQRTETARINITLTDGEKTKTVLLDKMLFLSKN